MGGERLLTAGAHAGQPPASNRLYQESCCTLKATTGVDRWNVLHSEVCKSPVTTFHPIPLPTISTRNTQDDN